MTYQLPSFATPMLKFFPLPPRLNYDAVPSTPLTALLPAWLLSLSHALSTLPTVTTWAFFYLLLSLVIWVQLIREEISEPGSSGS